MTDKTESDVVVLNKLDREALLLTALKNKAYLFTVKAAEAQAEANGYLSAYKEAAKATLFNLFYPFNVYTKGHRFWIHDGQYQGTYFFQDNVFIDDKFNWYVALEKELLTAKGKPSKVTESCYLSPAFLVANMKTKPLQIVGAPVPIADNSA